MGIGYYCIFVWLCWVGAQYYYILDVFPIVQSVHCAECAHMYVLGSGGNNLLSIFYAARPPMMAELLLSRRWSEGGSDISLSGSNFVQVVVHGPGRR